MSIAIDHSAPKKERFLQAYALSGRINKAAEDAKCNTNAHYTWMKEDPDYPMRFEAAKAIAAHHAEDELVRRGVEGWEEPVFGTTYSPAGKPTGKSVVGHMRRYSDACLIFLLKALYPEKYRERYEHAVKHSMDQAAPLRLEELYVDHEPAPEPIDVESTPKLEE